MPATDLIVRQSLQAVEADHRPKAELQTPLFFSRSHTTTEPSSPPAAAVIPSGAIARHSNRPTSHRYAVLFTLPETSQRHAVPSQAAETSVWPSGLNATCP